MHRSSGQPERVLAGLARLQRPCSARCEPPNHAANTLDLIDAHELRPPRRDAESELEADKLPPGEGGSRPPRRGKPAAAKGDASAVYKRVLSQYALADYSSWDGL